MFELTLCHLYPDLLNIYGDRGNIIALQKRAEWRGIRMHVVPVTLGDAFDAEDYDIVFLGGGQNFEQEIIQKDILYQKGNEIKNAIHGGKVFLCICGGYQLLGKFFRTSDGREIQFLGVLDLWTVEGKERMIGNLLFECDFLKDGMGDHRIIGFENHSGKTYLGEGVTPLGKVILGFGNNGEDGFEGARYKNVFCSYSHGSLLPKNPKLADYLLLTALKEKYKDVEVLAPLNDRFEKKARDAMIKRLCR